jgi:dTDP-4-amino-4,6-dideoxygalactose transaminase
MIKFSIPTMTGDEEKYIMEVFHHKTSSTEGSFINRCNAWFEEKTGTPRALLTGSCTHALELAALLFNIEPDDEVIMPSFTFPSTANAFLLRGAKVVFVDIRPDTMNMDETLIEAAVTERTKAIVPVHYAGVGCEMDTIMDIAERHGLKVAEDAAQGFMAEYKGRMLGTIGHIGAYSFHETKNFQCGGEGGMVLFNDESLIRRGEILREYGTNRRQFFRGEVDKYSWQEVGSTWRLNEINAAYLYAQLLHANEINDDRLRTWNAYYKNLCHLETEGRLELQKIPENCRHNGHIFYLKVRDLAERSAALKYLKENGVYAVFHFVPLHTSKAGKKYCTFHGTDTYTTKESERLIRLPLYYKMNAEDIEKVCRTVEGFFKAG